MNKWLFVGFVGFAAGISFRSFFDFGISFAFFSLVLGAAFLFIQHSHILQNVRMLYAKIGLVLLFAGLGMLRFGVSDISPPLSEYVGVRETFVGIIVDEPDIREAHTKLTFQITQAGEAEVSQAVKALLVTERYPQFEYGDEVIVRGVLKKPENFSDSDSGRVFDYVSWLKKDGIYYQMFYPTLELVGHGRGNFVKASLFATKNALMNSISRVIPEPHASLLGGIVFGAKHSLGEELLDAFRATGIIHIVVLSGYNVTIIAEWIGKLASFAPRYLALSLSSLGIVGFALMTGAGATVVRASIMALIVLLARATGRIYEITTALLFAAFLMLLENPHILIFDASFQLSFLATVGLIYLAPRLQKWFSFLPKVLGIREVASATLSTQIFVLPLLLYLTGTLSVVSLPVNVLVLVAVPLIMAFGFITGVVGIANTTLAFPTAFAAYLLLEYSLSVVDFFGRLPFAAVTIPQFPLWLMIFFYGLFVFLLSKARKYPA